MPDFYSSPCPKKLFTKDCNDRQVPKVRPSLPRFGQLPFTEGGVSSEVLNSRKQPRKSKRDNKPSPTEEIVPLFRALPSCSSPSVLLLNWPLFASWVPYRPGQTSNAPPLFTGSTFPSPDTSSNINSRAGNRPQHSQLLQCTSSILHLPAMPPSATVSYHLSRLHSHIMRQAASVRPWR